ncbi:MAG TPA: LysM peptidoglycan-binding domain-containing protein [Elusimicrobiota bacterium]|nr:LysM peptidoglycan-binding domain-containing protein [Elusimicrobiota bacterium]
MRITNLHLIMSFLLLAGVGIFGYQLFLKGPASLLVSRGAPVSMPVSPAVERYARMGEQRLPPSVPESQPVYQSQVQTPSPVQPIPRSVPEPVSAQRRDSIDLEKLYRVTESVAPEEEKPRGPLDHDVRYKVQRGDNLWKIARKTDHYGRGAAWVRIWRANEKKIPDFDQIVTGQVLLIPAEKRSH